MYVDANDEDVENTKRRFKKELARTVFMKNLDWEAFDKAYDKMQEDRVAEEIEEKLSKNGNESEEGGDDMSSDSSSGGGDSFGF